jgi:hypothetical protein
MIKNKFLGLAEGLTQVQQAVSVIKAFSEGNFYLPDQEHD